MDKLLHIIAAPRGADSRTLEVSRAFTDGLKKKYPSCRIDELNLFQEPLPELTLKMISGKYTLLSGRDLSPEAQKAWEPVESHIRRFLSADAYLISSPMWNFNVPYPLKHYIDIIIQPKYLFRYTENGVEGLVKNKKMTVITSRGGDYSLESHFHSYDFQEPYLRAVFGFVGITDVTFINAQPMDALGEKTQKAKIEEARQEAVKASAKI